MQIERYSDLEKIENNMIVDLSKLEQKVLLRALDFLLGLTIKKGSLKKLENNRYLVIINKN